MDQLAERGIWQQNPELGYYDDEDGEGEDEEGEEERRPPSMAGRRGVHGAQANLTECVGWM